MSTGFRRGYGKGSGEFAVSMASLITYRWVGGGYGWKMGCRFDKRLIVCLQRLIHVSGKCW